MDIFSRYAPFIQDYIFSHRWQALRDVQVAAGDVIFNTDRHLLLCASTASGKTEAAFFPILTLLAEDPPRSIGALYIAPLKALINDQFGRITELAKEADIPVWAWHGDVSQTRKKKLLERPSGILQITPESLEAMLIRKQADIVRLFGDLRFIVIDEIHSLMRGDRGAQTICLIERLTRKAGADPRRIGLSATIGDTAKAAQFLASGTERPTAVPAFEAKALTWRLSVAHFYKFEDETKHQCLLSPDPSIGSDDPAVLLAQKIADFRASQAFDCAPDASALPSAQESTLPDRAVDEAAAADLKDLAPGDGISAQAIGRLRGADPGLAYIYEHSLGRKCLVFANSREEAESVTSSLRRFCEVLGKPDRFLIHHGNLSSALRQAAEEEMRDDSKRSVAVTTATLELGIDIGRLERAFQIDAPFTVSGFLQRLGRTGRRSMPPEMWFVVREDVPESRASLGEVIPWKLLQTIALIELYRQERWVEPPRLERLPYSLLYHQTMSTLLSMGEASPAELARAVLTLAPFARISTEDYKILLRHLVQTDHIERTEAGTLIVGLKAERLTSSFKFYAVFQENEEFSVRAGSTELGTIVRPPNAGERIAIAGRCWEVLEVDLKRRVVYVEKVRGKVPAFFGLCPGDIHTKILERMKRVLAEESSYPYLMKHALERLGEGREAADRAGLLKRPLVCISEETGVYQLFPWLGTYAFLALERLLKIKCAKRLGLSAFESSRPYFIQFQMKARPSEFFAVAADEAQKLADPLALVYPGENPIFEKYDEFIPPELVRKGFACGVLDIEGLKTRAAQWGRLPVNELDPMDAPDELLRTESQAWRMPEESAQRSAHRETRDGAPIEDIEAAAPTKS